MYPPPQHQSSDIQKMIEVIKHYPLGMLITSIENAPYVSHIPFIYSEENGKLVAHIDALNPQLKSLEDNAEALVVFKGPDTYISPSVYSTKQLPTWNYIIVHVSGTIKMIKEPKAIKESMIVMTEFLEGTNPEFVLNYNDVRMDRLIPHIKVFEITIAHWEGKFKLSQDKNEEDYQRAKQAMINNGEKNATSFINTIYE